jgi:hypothetical protein
MDTELKTFFGIVPDCLARYFHMKQGAHFSITDRLPWRAFSHWLRFYPGLMQSEASTAEITSTVRAP